MPIIEEKQKDLSSEEYAKIQSEIREILEKTGFGDIIVKIQNFKLVFLFGISKRKIED